MGREKNPEMKPPPSKLEVASHEMNYSIDSVRSDGSVWRENNNVLRFHVNIPRSYFITHLSQLKSKWTFEACFYTDITSKNYHVLAVKIKFWGRNYHKSEEGVSAIAARGKMFGCWEKKLPLSWMDCVTVACLYSEQITSIITQKLKLDHTSYNTEKLKWLVIVVAPTLLLWELFQMEDWALAVSNLPLLWLQLQSLMKFWVHMSSFSVAITMLTETWSITRY